MANPGRNMSKPPGSEMCIDELDVATGIQESQKKLEKTWMKIFKKFEQRFMKDISLNLDGFTYDTPAGERTWHFKYDMAAAIGEPLSQVKKTCSTLMQSEEDQNSDLSVLSNVLHGAFPHKAKVSKNPNPKNQAADNIVRHYKHQFWSKNKKEMKMNSLFAISSAPPICEQIVTPSKTYNSTMLQEICLSKSGLREPIKGSSPILFSVGQKFSSHPVSITMNLNPQDYASKTFEGIIDNWPIAIPKPIPAQQHKDKNSIMPPNYSSWSSSSDRTMSPSKAMTTQHQMTIERNHASYREDTKQLQNRTRTLTTSSSALPVSHSANRDFESLYRNLTLNRTQLDLSPGNAQAQISKAVYSLVSSPGSQTAKRSISHSFSFSPVKKPRNATESLTGTSKPIYKSMDSSHVSWLESSSSNLHHSVFASPLATHMLPHSPVSLRSFPRAVKDRTNPRKPSYQENGGNDAEN